MDNDQLFYCRGCGSIKPGGKIPDDHALIGLFALEIGLVDAAGQPTKVGVALTLTFYQRLLAAAPYLADIFPPDLLDAGAALDGAGMRQRDSLLKAILAVATLFNPDDPKRMGRLNEALDGMGQAHRRFKGRGVAARIEEYAAVVGTLLAVLHDYARTAGIPQLIWEEAYEPALRRALEYSSGRMLCAQAADTSEGVEDTAVMELAQPVDN